MIKKVTAYRCADGKDFPDITSAKNHEYKIIKKAITNFFDEYFKDPTEGDFINYIMETKEKLYKILVGNFIPKRINRFLSDLESIYRKYNISVEYYFDELDDTSALQHDRMILRNRKEGSILAELNDYDLSTNIKDYNIAALPESDISHELNNYLMNLAPQIEEFQYRTHCVPITTYMLSRKKELKNILKD